MKVVGLKAVGLKVVGLKAVGVRVVEVTVGEGPAAELMVALPPWLEFAEHLPMKL